MSQTRYSDLPGSSPTLPQRSAPARAWLLAGMAAAVIATLGACAQAGPPGSADEGGRFAHGHGMHGHGMRGPMGPDAMARRIDRSVEWVLSDVNATPEQKQKVAAIAKQAAAELAPLREAGRAQRRQAMDVLAAPTVDRAALERLRATQLQSMEAASRRLTQALADIAEVLTPEQRAQLRARMEQRMQRRRG